MTTTCLESATCVRTLRSSIEPLAVLAARAACALEDSVQVDYFHEHQARMDYRAARRAGQPIGSGPIEATCRQYQCRFKRTGQFWSQDGDEALLCLETLWRNGRWILFCPQPIQWARGLEST